MGKALLYLTVGVCLVASAQPLGLLDSLLNPVGNILNSVVNVVGGVVEVVVPVPESVSVCNDQTTSSLLTKALTGVVLTLGDTVSNVLETVVDVLEAVVKLLKELIEALLGTIASLVVSLTTCYNSLLNQPLVTVKELEVTAIASVNIQTVFRGLEDALKPLQAILDSVVKQLVGTSASSCIGKIVTNNFTTQVLGGLVEVLRCRNPLLKEVTKGTTNIAGLIADAGDLMAQVFGNVNSCAEREASSLDTGNIVSCLTTPLAECRSGLDALLATVLPVVQTVMNKTLQIQECQLRVVAKAVSSLVNQLNLLAQCAAGNGVTVVLPSIPVKVPNFTEIAEKACVEIQLYISSALGSKSPYAQLERTINSLIDTLEYICSEEIGTIVNRIINETQESIDYVKETVKNNTNPEVEKCVSNAQSDLDKLGPKAEKEIVSCAAAIGPDAAEVIAEAAEMEVELKKGKINACAEAFIMCIKYSKRSDNSIQMCFDEAISDAQNRIIEINKKITAATEKANDLIKRDQTCLSEGVDDTDMKARNILNELKECLLKLNVVLPSKEIITVVETCTKDLKIFVLNLRPVLYLIRDLVKAIERLLAVILQIVADVLNKVVVPLLEGVEGILKSLAGALVGNKNSTVQSCTGDRDRFKVLCVEAKERAEVCVKTKKVLAAEYSLLAVTEERTVTTVIENAEINAQVKCQGGDSEASILNCYANFKSNLEVTVELSKERVQYYESAMKLLVAESLSCVYTEETKVPVRVDNELENIRVCLSKENINVYFKS